MIGSGAGLRLARAGLMLAGLLAAARPAGAQAGPPAGDAIDDPKVARRLGMRVAAPGEAWPVPEATGGAPVETLAARPVPAEPAGPRVPHIKLGLRRFDFVRIGATAPGSTSGTAAGEAFDSLSFDIYPISSFVRLGLTSQYGWQEGTFNGHGDYFLAQSFSLGGQLPGRLLTPFAEAFGGGGYMRRVQFDRTVPTVYWQLGVDVGAELFVARHGFVSLALGYLHPVNGFASTQVTGTSVSSASFTTVFVDTWSLKVGVGL